MNEKSIALIDPVGGKAGMDFYDCSLMKSLADRGYEAFLFSNFDSTTKGVHLINSFNNKGVNKIAAIFNNFFYFLKALVFCKKNKIPWVILHLFRGGIFDLITIGIARLLALKIILIVHDVESLDAPVLPFTRKIILTTFNHSKVVHNFYSFRKLEEIIDKKSMGNVHIIPHGNYLSLYNNPALNVNSLHGFTPRPGERYLLFFGQLKKAKGLDVLLKAFAISKSSFHLIIAGKERDETYRNHLKFIRENNLESKITAIIRFVTDEERDFFFRIADAVVLPYKKVYQSGVLLMAMSYSKTIIASDIEPNREVIQNGVNGLLFRSGNIKELAEIFEKLESGLYNESSLRIEALKTAETLHNWSEIGRFYTEILET